MKPCETIVMKAIALCFKPYLKPEEAYIFTNLERSQFLKRVNEFGIFKTSSGYYSREELVRMMAGERSLINDKLKRMKL